MDGLFHFTNARKEHPDVEQCLLEIPDELGSIARRWFNVLRDCGNDVTELVHDGYPCACVETAAFAYVGAFKRHVNVGFYRGAELDDPAGLLQGSGKMMRHVKLFPDKPVDESALSTLIHTAYNDMKQRLSA